MVFFPQSGYSASPSALLQDYRGYFFSPDSITQNETNQGIRGGMSTYFAQAELGRRLNTFVASWAGFVYVAFTIDVFARCIVGWRVRLNYHSDHGSHCQLATRNPWLRQLMGYKNRGHLASRPMAQY
jgi:transposase InsO family protein